MHRLCCGAGQARERRRGGRARGYREGIGGWGIGGGGTEQAAKRDSQLCNGQLERASLQAANVMTTLQPRAAEPVVPEREARPRHWTGHYARHDLVKLLLWTSCCIIALYPLQCSCAGWYGIQALLASHVLAAGCATASVTARETACPHNGVGMRGGSSLRYAGSRLRHAILMPRSRAEALRILGTLEGCAPHAVHHLSAGRPQPPCSCLCGRNSS